MSAPTAAPAWLETAATAADAAPADRVPLDKSAKPKPRPGVAAPPAPAPTADPAGGAELARRGYDPWSLLPSTTALLALTVAVPLVAGVYVPKRLWVEVLIAPLAALWLVQLIRCGYRMMAFDYRLTATHLTRRLGRLYPPEEPLDLTTVERVVVRRWPFGWLTNTGTVRVVPEDAAAPAVIVVGIHQPREFAATIEEAVQKARERGVLAVKVPASPRPV